MKNFTLIVVLAFAIQTATAQDSPAAAAAKPDRKFQSFRWALGVGYVFADGITSQGGGCAYQEPSYRITDNIAVGLKMEWALTGHQHAYINRLPQQTVSYLISRTSFTLNGQVYWGKKFGKFRPFSGAGLGLYTMATNLDERGRTNLLEAIATNRFGIYPRLGFDYRAFTMNIESNVIPKAIVITQAQDDIAVRVSYFSVKVGFFVGGAAKS